MLMTGLAEEAGHWVHWEEGAKLRGRGDVQGPEQGKACPSGPRGELGPELWKRQARDLFPWG